MEAFYDRDGEFQGTVQEYLEDLAADDAAREEEAYWQDYAADHAEWQAWSQEEIDDTAFAEWAEEQDRLAQLANWNDAVA